MTILGSCLCGRVRYAIEGRISPVWFCHCSKCRRSTGSAFHASAICRKEKFQWLAGQDEISEYEDTPRYKTRFCRVCGSPVPSYLASHDAMFLHVGALDGDPGARPSHHIFAGSKAPWHEIHDGLPAYEGHAPGGDEPG